MCVVSVVYNIYLFFFLRRDCIMGAGLNIESLLWVEESEITIFFYQNWYFYNRRNCCTSIRSRRVNVLTVPFRDMRL